jgi:hypothetical protein
VLVIAETIFDENPNFTAQAAFPEDVDYWVEALYPARQNQARAKIDLRYSCRDSRTGGLIIPCYIRLDPPSARPDTGGHISSLHLVDRPVGRHSPTEGAVDGTGYFKSTYYASEVAGVVDTTIHCSTGWGVCRSGKVAFGVGTTALQELGPGVGYTLVDDKPAHPSNHWGVPGFITAVQNVARLFVETYPDSPLRYNDISLQYGGIFDVATASRQGYDWTPPHSTHRLGTNMDIGIPRGNAQRALLLRLYQMQGVRVLQEDIYHWHLMY